MISQAQFDNKTHNAHDPHTLEHKQQKVQAALTASKSAGQRRNAAASSSSSQFSSSSSQ
jgi:hypothetical protein